MKTQKLRKSRGVDAGDQENTSGKKMVQARLPFKLITTPTSESADEKGAKSVNTTEGRKRKLSFHEQEEEASSKNKIEQSPKRRSVRHDNSLKEAVKKAEKATKTKENKNEKKEVAASVVVLSDDSNDHHGSGLRITNVRTIAKQKQCENMEDSLDVHSDDVELIGSTDEEEVAEKSKVPEKPKVFLTPSTTAKGKGVNKTPASDKNTSKKATTPQSGNKSTKKAATPQSGNKSTKTTTTPKSGNKSAGRGRKKSESSPAPSGSKLQIKLPLGGKKTKRRKQAAKKDAVAAEENDLSDDVEIISKELHPEKRPKLDDENVEQPKELEKSETIKTNDLEKEKEVSPQPEATEEEGDATKDLEKSVTPPPITESPKKQPASEDSISESEQSKSKVHEISSSSASNSDADTTVNSERSQRTNDPKDPTKPDKSASPKVIGDSRLQKKNLTPKQQKLLEQRLKAREEKERKIQEEREQKQREKEERELARKREREEKEEQRRKEREEKEDQRRKEREEKEDQRRKEREEKERKRLAEIEAKNEEKRKRNEAKEEELRKKEEERKRKEQEKEEAEMKKKKAAMAFTKFFSRPSIDSNNPSRAVDKDVAEEDHELLAFRPFQIKGDMKLAPVVRKRLNDEERAKLVDVIQAKGEKRTKELYLGELLSGAVRPYKWTPPPPEAAEEEKQKNGDDDVIVVEDELERAGQAIVEEHKEPLERFRAKFFKFHENRRPPYFGTWRKKSSVITPRRPLAQDKKFFDYEVDSDDEWEEEEPGESLDGSDDDKEKESEDEDYEVDNEWFVPHGHLSDEEMQNEEDDLGGENNNDREAQKAKLKILQQEFAQEMKKKTEKIKPRLIGCIWVDENGNQPESCPKIIWESLGKHAALCPEPLVMEEMITVGEKSDTVTGQNMEKGTTNGESSRLKPITLTEEMLRQLVKLIHGNTHSKNFLIKEFIAYIEANEESVRNGDVRGPLKSAVREKIDEYAQWQVIELSNSNDGGMSKSGGAKSQKAKKKLCWVVPKAMLESMDLNEMELNNNWEYILQPRHRSRVAPKEEATPTVEGNGNANGEDSNGDAAVEMSVDQCSIASGNVTTSSPPTQRNKNNNKNSDIKKFAKILTAEEKSQQLQKPKPTESTNPSPASQKSQTPKPKKRVPLLISVARGQKISTPDKNARISQFLKTINDAKENEEKEGNASTTTTPTPMETDDVVVLD